MLGFQSSLSLKMIKKKQFQIISNRKQHNQFTPYLQSPEKPLISLSQALVLQREVFPAPCTGQRDTFLAFRGQLWKQETRCFPRIMLLQKVSKVVPELSEKPPSWIVSLRSPVSRRFLLRTAHCGLGHAAITHPLHAHQLKVFMQVLANRKQCFECLNYDDGNLTKSSFPSPSPSVTEWITDNHKARRHRQLVRTTFKFFYQNNRTNL